jgi:hypothetical protein
MKFNLEYGFNNESLTKFEEYELKFINVIKYIVPKLNNTKYLNYSVIRFDEYEENDKPLIDFINLGKLSLENEEDTDKLLLDYVNEYGLLGLIHDLPINRYYTLDKKILLKEFNNISGKEYYDNFNTMDIVNYFKIFFPTDSKEEIKELIEKSNKLICQHSMEKFITPELNELYYKNEKYYEQAEKIVNHAQTLYNILKELKKESGEKIKYSIISKLESNHIRTNLEYNGISIHIRSLKEYIDENFKLYAIPEKKYLKLCKHCDKAFTAPNPKTEYDTFSCKNQENVYKSRTKASSNVTITDEGITVKNIISDE